MKLTRISDEEIGYAVLAIAIEDQWCFRGDTLTDNLPSYQAVARAQLEADRKVSDKEHLIRVTTEKACERETFFTTTSENHTVYHGDQYSDKR